MPRKRAHDLLERLGRRVAEVRRARGFTQAALAEAIDIETATLSRWENGERAISLSTLANVAELLDVPLARLLDEGKPVPKPKPSVAPAEAEVLRLFRKASPARRKIVLALLRELSA
jgi:transcriptional regulator with XRE-family HTH domain